MNSRERNISAVFLVQWLIVWHLGTLALSAAILWVEVFYFQNSDAIFSLSWHAGDQPPVAPDAAHNLGIHTFSDFLLPWAQAKVTNPWLDYPFINQLPPGAMFVFRIFSLPPYAIGLIAFLCALVAGMLAPLACATRALPLWLRISLAFVLVGFSAPFAMVLDRGNIQGILVIPLGVFAWAWRSSRWRVLGFSIVLATMMKVYPAVLIAALLGHRKFRLGAVVGVFGIAAFVLSFVAFGRPVPSIISWVQSMRYFTNAGPLVLIQQNHSLVGMLINAAVSLFGPRSPAILWLQSHTLVPGIIYCVMSLGVIAAVSLPWIVRLAVALSMLGLIVPVSYAYSYVFVFVIVAELIALAVTEQNESMEAVLPRSLAYPLVAALVITLFPNPIALPGGHSSLSTILQPLAWLVLCVASLVQAYGLQGTKGPFGSSDRREARA